MEKIAENRTTDILDFLSKEGNYPLPVEKVIMRETHSSYVFLTDGFVYKMKKPVQYSYLNLLNLDQRKRNCEEEVAVNRRLAPEVYLGVVPLSKSESGEFNFDEKGKVVEWLVKMKRLPDNLMMDCKIIDKDISEGDLLRLGKKLSDFYSRSHIVKMDREFYIQRLRNFICIHLNDLKDPVYGIKNIRLNKLLHLQLKFLSDHISSLELRVDKIIEAHGDLRPEHICFSDELVIIDALEFNKDFRMLDPMEELSYFSLECEMLEAEWVGNRIIEIYKTQTGDSIENSIISFYKSIRSVLRALNSFRHIQESRYNHDSKWKLRGEQYLALAEKFIANC